MTPQEIEDLKTVEYYSAAVTAWFNTALEHDKSILTLAAGGIGLLITLLTTVGLSTAERSRPAGNMGQSLSRNRRLGTHAARHRYVRLEQHWRLVRRRRERGNALSLQRQGLPNR